MENNEGEFFGEIEKGEFSRLILRETVKELLGKHLGKNSLGNMGEFLMKLVIGNF